MLAEFGEPSEASVVSRDARIEVRFIYTSPTIDNRKAIISRSWRFESFESAVAFRELLLQPLPKVA